MDLWDTGRGCLLEQLHVSPACMHQDCLLLVLQVMFTFELSCSSCRFWLFINYPGSSLASVEPFVCQQIYKDNYLIASWDECPYGKDGWKPLAGVSLAFIFVYPRECIQALLTHFLQLLYSGNRPHLSLFSDHLQPWPFDVHFTLVR